MYWLHMLSLKSATRIQCSNFSFILLTLFPFTLEFAALRQLLCTVQQSS